VDTLQTLSLLYSEVKTERDIFRLQQGSILDDSIPDVQKFLETRTVQVQPYMSRSFGLPLTDFQILHHEMRYFVHARTIIALSQICQILDGDARNGCQPAWRLAYSAKGLGHYSPVGSYWIAMSLIADGESEGRIKEYLDHLSSWAAEHVIFKPRYLHVQAEIACRSNPLEGPPYLLWF
jgi:hypothetical protein